MKKLLFLIATVSVLLVGCGSQEDMSSAPDSAATNAAAGSGTSTNQ
jgi:hypothetical protein